MSTKSPGNLKPLQYESYEELKEHAFNIDKQLLGSLKRIDNHRRFKYFLEIEREARMKLQDGDEESAYIMYNRGMTIFRMINDSMDSAFRRSKDGTFFYETSKRMLLDFGTVAENLKQRFKHQQIETSITNSNSHSDISEGECSKHPDDLKFKTYAKPAEIVRFVGNGMNALVLDYRDDQSESIEYKNTRGTMKVVHLNRRDIVPGSLLHSLFKALDISVRPLLENIAHFDVVALLGDINDIAKEKGTKTFILVEALTTYNFHYKLKRPPVIIDGGFMNWKNAYPYYVNETYDVPRFEKTLEEQFAIWMVEARKAHELRIQYPNLSASINKITIADEAKQMPKNTAQPPIIDRTKKPADVAIKSLSDQNHHRTTFMDRECRNAHSNKENCVPADGPRRSTSPFPQILGGAGGQNNNQGRRIPSIGPPHPRRRLPPSEDTMDEPDHNIFTPHSPVPNQQQPQMIADINTDFFQSSYNIAMNRIANDSEYKKTPFGQTGLFNMGNTCFMNSTLQPLFHTPHFSQLFREQNAAPHVNIRNKFGTKGIISGCFSALVDLMWSGNYTAIRPAFFLDMFAKRVNAELADRRQHDAQEFQIYLLDALHEDTNRVDARRPFEQNYDSRNLQASAADFFKRSKLFSSSPVNDLFNLTTIAVVQCKTCNATSVRFEAVNQISVELPDSGDCLKLKDCLEAHFSTTNLETLWDCPQCKSKQPASRSTKIWDIPEILIIHLKRFSMDDQYFVKNDVEVTFDVNELDVSPYIHLDSSISNTKYSLYAITNHIGRLNSGHYTSQLINLASVERNWLKFDDEDSTPCAAPSPMSKRAFLLYYCKLRHK